VGETPSDVAALAEVFAAMPLAFVRLVPFALRHFVAFAGDGVLRLVLHGLGNAGALLVRGLSHVGCVTRSAAHGGAETLVRLNEIRGPVVGDHRNGSLGILGVDRNADQGTKTREQNGDGGESETHDAPSSFLVNEGGASEME
jgi:hypothetical protein